MPADAKSLQREIDQLRTQLHVVQRQAQAREDRSRMILDSAIECAVIALDLVGRVTEWNEGARRILGWSGPDIMGRSATVIFTPEDRAAGVPEREMKMALEIGHGTDERWHLREDGTRFWANGEMMPLRDEEGTPHGFIKILRDRTEQHAAATKANADAEFLRSVLASSADCIKVLDLDAKLTFMTEGGKRLMEVSDFNAICGCPWPDFWEGQGNEDAKAAIATARAGGTAQFRGRANTMADTAKWWDVQVTPIIGLDGHPAQILVVSRDITAMHQAEKALVEAHDRREALLTLSNGIQELDGLEDIAHAAAQAIGTTIGVERAGYATMTADGITVEIERDWTARPGIVSTVGQHDMRAFGNYFEDLRRGEPAIIEDTETDPRTDAAELAQFDIKAMVNMPLVERGNLVAVLFANAATPRRWTPEELDFIRDVAELTRSVSQRRRAEHALQRLATSLEQQVEKRTRERDRLWQLSRDPFLISDTSGVWLSVNPVWTELLGWSKEQLLGRTSEWMEHPDDRNKTRGEVVMLAEGGTTTRFENRFRGSDGEYRWFSWTAIGVEGLFYCVARDITVEREQAQSREELEEQLRQSQKMEAVGQLTGGLAHDFNNLLTAVTGGLELLSHRLAAGQYDKLDRYMNMALTGAHRAAALTQRLLAFSRRQTLAPTMVDVDRLVTGMEEIVSRTLGPAIDLNVSATAGLWPILVDAPQLENALLNLCINARDAMQDGGRLTIETGNKALDARSAAKQDLPEGEYVSLCVTDTGTGMTPEVIERVFDPFYTTKPIGEGTGLGLSMIYGFTRQSGGQVRVYSEVGAGTTICLYLPRYVGAAETREIENVDHSRHRAEEGAIILLVEDEASIRELVTEILGDAGYSVLTAINGPAGVAMLQSGTRIDLLITDVGLPGGLNGRQVADAGRSVRPDLKVLFVTGYAANAAVGAGHMEAGMEVLTKPFNVLELEQRVGKMLLA